MARGLSERQERILEFIHHYVQAHGYPPSIREIGEAVRLRSSSSVHRHLKNLQARGYVRRDPERPRALELIDHRPIETEERPARRAAATGVRFVPLLGRVRAGSPTLAVEDTEGSFPLPQDWVRPDEEVFMLRVEGDSMVGAGILPGDLLAVRRQNHAYNGDIIVALLGEEVTVKRFFRETDRIRLQPENPRMQPIYVEDVRILGRAIGLIRRL